MPDIAEIVSSGIREYEGYIDNYQYGSPYHTPLWDFTRTVKSFFAEDADPHHVFSLISPEVERHGGWGQFHAHNKGGVNDEDAYLEFMYDWDKISSPSGVSPLEEARGRAEESPLDPERCRDHPLPTYRRFVGIAGWLQVIIGDHPIMLPCEAMGKLLDVSAMQITRFRHLAEKDGYIKKVCEHSRAKHRATEFRFDITRFPVLAQHERMDEGV